MLICWQSIPSYKGLILGAHIVWFDFQNNLMYTTWTEHYVVIFWLNLPKYCAFLINFNLYKTFDRSRENVGANKCPIRKQTNNLLQNVSPYCDSAVHRVWLLTECAKANIQHLWIFANLECICNSRLHIPSTIKICLFILPMKI